MGRLFLIDLEEEVGNYHCKFCHTGFSIARHTRFAGGYYGVRGGIAHLLAKVVNVTMGEAVTYPWNRGGPCTTADIFCVRCGSIVGVKCLATDPPDNAVGKFLLEKHKVVAPDGTCIFVPVP